MRVRVLTMVALALSSLITFTTLPAGAAGAKPASSTCDLVLNAERLHDALVTSKRVNAATLAFLLRGIERTVVGVQVNGATELGAIDPTITVLDSLTHVGSKALTAALVGDVDDLNLATAKLSARFGRAVSFQVLEAPTDESLPFRTVKASHQISLLNATTQLRKEFSTSNFRPFSIYDKRHKTTYGAFPITGLAGIVDEHLRAAGIRVVDASLDEWMVGERTRPGGATLIRGPGFAIASEDAYPILRKLAQADAYARNFEVSPTLRAALSVCPGAPCASDAALPMTLTVPRDILNYLDARFPDVGMDTRNALATYFARLYSIYLPDAVVTPKLLVMDGLQINHQLGQESGKRLLKAWADLVAAASAAPAANVPAATESPATALPEDPAAPEPTAAAPAAESVVKAAPIDAAPPRPGPGQRQKSVADRDGVIADEAVGKILGFLKDNKILLSPSASGGIPRAFLDSLRPIDKTMSREDYATAKAELLAIKFTTGEHALILQRKAKALARLIDGWRVVQWALGDAGIDRDLTVNRVNATIQMYAERKNGHGIKITTMVADRSWEADGKQLPLRLTPAAHEALNALGMSDGKIRRMISNWHRIVEKGLGHEPEQPWTVLFRQELGQRAAPGDAIIARLQGDLITSVQNGEIAHEIDFYRRLAERHDLVPRDFEVRLAGERALTQIHVPARVMAELDLKKVSLQTVELTLAKARRTPIPSEEGKCFTLQEKDQPQIFHACFDRLGSSSGILRSFYQRSDVPASH